MSEPVDESPFEREGPRSPASRLLGVGARGAERIAEATGINQAVEDAVEEAIVRALRSPAVERALVRLIEGNAVQGAVQRALRADEVADAIVDALDTEVADRVWAEILASDKAQMLVQRIAEAPEVRAAIAEQGVGLITDVGYRLTKITEAFDDAAERIAHHVVHGSGEEKETNQVGLLTRALAGAVDVGLFALALSLGHQLFAWLFLGGDPLPPALAVGLGIFLGGALFVLFWALIGQTPGMRFLSIRLDVDGSREVGYWRALGRILALPLSLLPAGLGFLWILISPTRRAWHDHIAGTTVVYDTRTQVAPWSALDRTLSAAPQATPGSRRPAGRHPPRSSAS
jgi:uncharacterized RDD family membrane protein YckC